MAISLPSLLLLFISLVCDGAVVKKEISRMVRDVREAKKGHLFVDPREKMNDHYVQYLSSDKPAQVERRVDSDSMMLYSISEKKYVQFNQKKISRNKKLKFLSTGTGKNGRDKNKMFITETVSYGFFKIKLEGLDKYLCAKSNGKIAFKDEALVPDRSRIRKRCLFHWEFTRQMHVRLSLSFENVTWHLFARDGDVKLGLANDTSDIEQSFIWLPTFGRQVRKNVWTKTPSGNARSADGTTSGFDRVQGDRDDDDDDDSDEDDECDNKYLKRVNESYRKQIADLSKQLRDMKSQYAELLKKDLAKARTRNGKP